MPDSGILQHLSLPVLSEDVRVDAGFIAGDEVSSYYDPMIAKLIVRGDDRTEAIQKLKVALEQYEIVGPITNIAFLKKVCENGAFIAGELETGFIPKHKSQLLETTPVPLEVCAQTAIGVILQENLSSGQCSVKATSGKVGFTDSLQKRQIYLQTGSEIGGRGTEEVVVEVSQIGSRIFDVKVNDTIFAAVRSIFDTDTNKMTSFFRHTRLNTRIIFNKDNITSFSRGSQYSLRLKMPPWLEDALGVKDLTHSVLTPMPCKVLRVDVKDGDEVKKDQSLVVIESMKMETIIRSPQNGRIAKVVHKQGVSISRSLSFPTCTKKY